MLLQCTVNTSFASDSYMVKISASRTIKAPKAKVWALLADVESWPNWAPVGAMNRVIRHPVVSKQGNVITCDEEEQAGLIRAKHTDRYTLYPEERLEEEIVKGDFVGGITLTLKDIPEGTLVHVDADVSPRNPSIDLISKTLGGDKILTQFWIDLFEQLASISESKCSIEQPMYCPTRMLDAMLKKPSLPIQKLVNTGKRNIDIESLTIYNDNYWKGIYPSDTPIPSWIFQNGFKKKFWSANGTIKGVTSAFDDRINAANLPRQIDPNNPSKGILLEYIEPQFMLFYDVLKMISDDVVVGEGFIGKYPNGISFLKFTLARKYGFDFMNPEDHRELFNKYGRSPDVNKIMGVWEGRMISSASLTPPLFRLQYKTDQSGKVTCEWNFVRIFKGGSAIELTPEELLMFDFTNFHDEIRMIRDDVMVGKYVLTGSKLFDVVRDSSLGLVQFETASEGTRPVIYYYLSKIK